MRDAVLAVDLGTARVKAGIVDVQGDLVSVADRDYALIRGSDPAHVEQDPRVWWDATRAAVRAAVDSAAGTRVIGACIGGQGPSLVPTDAAGEPVANAIIWMDRRSEPQRRALSERAGQEVTPYSMVPRAMWIKEHRPDVYERTRWFMQAWDHIAVRMTGSAVASSFRGATVFPPELIAASGVDGARFPHGVLMGDVGGTLRGDVARELGLDGGIPVAGGVNDSTAAILGTGIVRKGLAIDYGGTSGGLGLAWDEAIGGEGITVWPLPVPGLYICGGPLAASGRSFEWLRATFGYADAAAVTADAATVPPGSDGVVFLPYLAGERTPLWDDRARGVLFGLTERHGRAHVARAVLEGVAFALRHIADTIAERGGRIEELRVVGGQGRSALWARIKADALGVTVAVPRVLEGALMGEAILALVGAGRLPDPIEGAARFPRIDARIATDPAVAGAYAQSYAVFRELYPRLRDLMPQG